MAKVWIASQQSRSHVIVEWLSNFIATGNAPRGFPYTLSSKSGVYSLEGLGDNSLVRNRCQGRLRGK